MMGQYDEFLTFLAMQAVDEALAKFAPKPVLPEWKTFYEAQEMQYFSHWDGNYVTVDINARDKNKNPISVNEDRYNVIRELTATSAPEPAQKWNMPTLQQINEIFGPLYGTAPTNALDTWYDAIRNKIMAMNKS